MDYLVFMKIFFRCINVTTCRVPFLGQEVVIMHLFVYQVFSISSCKHAPRYLTIYPQREEIQCVAGSFSVTRDLQYEVVVRYDSMIQEGCPMWDVGCAKLQDGRQLFKKSYLPCQMVCTLATKYTDSRQVQFLQNSPYNSPSNYFVFEKYSLEFCASVEGCLSCLSSYRHFILSRQSILFITNCYKYE